MSLNIQEELQIPEYAKLQEKFYREYLKLVDEEIDRLSFSLVSLILNINSSQKRIKKFL